MRVFLLDLGLQFHARQAQVLELAKMLDNTKGIDVRVGCFAQSQLAARLTASKLSALELSGGAANPFFLFKLRGYLKENEPDILHAFGGSAVCAVKNYLKGRKSKPHLFVSLDAQPAAEPDRPVPPACLSGKDPFAQVSKIFCPSAGALNNLMSAGFSGSLLYSLPAGLPSEEAPRRIPRSDGRFVFLTSAPLRPESGLMSVIEALPLLKERDDIPQWEVRIIGEGKDFGRLLERARALGVDAFISLLGRQNQEEQLPLCDAAIAPNLNSQDCNTFILQAWRAHVPLICSSVPSTAELLSDERNALLFIPGNSAALTSAMLRCMIDPNLYQRLLNAGQLEIPRHTMSAVSAEILNFYRQAADNDLAAKQD